MDPSTTRFSIRDRWHHGCLRTFAAVSLTSSGSEAGPLFHDELGSEGLVKVGYALMINKIIGIYQLKQVCLLVGWFMFLGS